MINWDKAAELRVGELKNKESIQLTVDDIKTVANANAYDDLVAIANIRLAITDFSKERRNSILRYLLNE